jgi:4-diphosphocytidyl-2-C-methyl-D-erythritol kinase
MDKIILKAPAKINLFLHIFKKRPDGYHDIDSLIQAVSLHDELTLEKSDDIEFISEGLDDVAIEDNLAYKAARLIAGMAYYPGVRITLKKRIPVGAGLGGGSADAAFTIRGLIQLFDLKLDKNMLIKKAGGLGADIPFFLSHGQARVTGIGDNIENYYLPLNYEIIIVKPTLSLKTEKIYKAIDKKSEGKFHLTKKDNYYFLKKRITDPEFVRIAKNFINDFEEVVFPLYPELPRIKNTLLSEGAFYAGLSGTGSAIFGLFPPNHNSGDISRRFLNEKTLTFICKPVLLLPSCL